MINEKPIIELLSLEIYNDDEAKWEAWTDPLNRLSIQRGGQRKGTTNTVDVGTLTCTFVNAGDPLAGGTLLPNQKVRLKTLDTPQGHFEPGPDIVDVPAHDVEHGTSVLYTDGFETYPEYTANPGGWTNSASGYCRNTGQEDGDYGRTGLQRLKVAYTSTEGLVTRTFTGLSIGAPYTFKTWAQSASANTVEVRLSGIADVAGTSLTSWTWTELTRTFVATATSHTISIDFRHASASAYAFLDDITFTQDAWTEHVPATYKPGPDVWVEDPPLPGTIIWAGLTNDFVTSYDLDKSTGEMNTFTALTAIDAVGVHAATPRYGAVTPGGVGYTTWALRLAALATSASTPVTVPVDNAPIVRYSI